MMKRLDLKKKSFALNKDTNRIARNNPAFYDG